MTWTTEKPTKPGWYWFRTQKGHNGHIVRVDGDMECERAQVDRRLAFPDTLRYITPEKISAVFASAEWSSEPIAMPEEPA